MTQLNLTKSVAKQFFSVATGGKNAKGYLNKEIIGSLVSAGSVLGGHEVKYDFAQINLAKVEELRKSGVIKGNYLQFSISQNHKYEEQIAALQLEIANLKGQLAEVPVQESGFSLSQEDNQEEIPF